VDWAFGHVPRYSYTRLCQIFRFYVDWRAHSTFVISKGALFRHRRLRGSLSYSHLIQANRLIEPQSPGHCQLVTVDRRRNGVLFCGPPSWTGYEVLFLL
jgi:hypothetical protein